MEYDEDGISDGEDDFDKEDFHKGGPRSPDVLDDLVLPFKQAEA